MKVKFIFLPIAKSGHWNAHDYAFVTTTLEPRQRLLHEAAGHTL
jgi:hypothetical protein